MRIASGPRQSKTASVALLVLLAIASSESRGATLEVPGQYPGIQAAIYDARVKQGDAESPRWGLSGFYASVVRPGTVRAGDAVALAPDLPAQPTLMR